MSTEGLNKRIVPGRRIAQMGIGLILAPLAPLATLMAAWWVSYAWLPEVWIPWFAGLGLLLGILVDIPLIKLLVKRGFHLSPLFWLAVLLFYSVGMFGLFMGVPIFHPLLAIPTGFVAGGRLAHETRDPARLRIGILRASMISTGFMLLVCIASAFFALTSPSTPQDLRGMLGLHFEISPSLLWGLILAGGLVLLFINWLLAGASTQLTHACLTRRALENGYN
jgi:hypothetical protein